FEAGNYPEEGGLPAAAWSKNGYELSRFDFESHILDGRNVVESLCDFLERECGHRPCDL
ncbi:MAG: hypothetical protein HW412_1685, partial [Bacteroidetes bacterium]|nr:hypothetical protein [Bacteroidota bacterium]